MNEESFSSQLADSMDMMGFEMPTDHLQRICGVEKMHAVLTAVVNHVHPMATVRQAKLASLYKKLCDQCDQKNDGSKSVEDLDPLKTKIRLIQQLNQKKKDKTKKKEASAEQIKENRKLLQKIQWMNIKLNEENKKLFFFTLNVKALDDLEKRYCCLGLKVSERVQAQIKKGREQTSVNCDAEVAEAVKDCLAPLMDFRRSRKEKLACVKNTGCEYEGSNITAKNWKSEILEHVFKKLGNFSWPQVFQALLEMLQQQIYSMQSLLDSNSVTKLSHSGRYSFLSSVDMQEQDLLERIFTTICFDILSESLQKESFETLKEQVGNNSDITSLKMFFDEKSFLEERLKVVENELQEVDKCIQEKIDESKNIKTRVIINLEEMSKSISSSKHFPKKLKLFQKEDSPPLPQLNGLQKVINKLCSSGLQEVQLFAKIPLVAIEKLSLTNEKVPIYEFASSYLKVITTTSKYSSAYPSWMKDSTSLALDDLLIHVWQQLSFLCMLCKAHSLMKPLAEYEVNMNFVPHSSDTESDKMKETYENFLAMISRYESNFVDVQQLSNILTNYPFNSIVPRDLLIDGLSIEYFEKLVKSNLQNEGLVFNVTEDTSEDSH